MTIPACQRRTPIPSIISTVCLAGAVGSSRQLPNVASLDPAHDANRHERIEGPHQHPAHLDSLPFRSLVLISLVVIQHQSIGHVTRIELLGL